jgi:hypothetical protein
MEIILAEGLEIRHPRIGSIDGLRKGGLSLEDGVALLKGQLTELPYGEALIAVYD